MSISSTNKPKNYISFDVMDGDKFVCTMKMPHCALFDIEEDEVMDFVYEHRPWLRRNENIHIEFNE